MIVSKKTTPLSCAANICMSVFMKFCGARPQLGSVTSWAAGGLLNTTLRPTHLNLVPPFLLVDLQAAEVMLNGHDAAVTRHELLILHQGEVDACAECDDGRFRRCSFV